MVVVWLALFHYYTKLSGFLAYMYLAALAARGEIKIFKSEFLILIGLALLVVLQLAFKSLLPVLIDLRFYWGWVIFYFIFKGKAVDARALTVVLVVVSTVTLIEALLVNTIVSPEVLPNFPDLEAGLREYHGEGYYQRPYSFGASATVGSSLLAVLIAICDPRGWRLWLSILAVLAFSSGTGFLALILVLCAKYRLWLLKAMLPISLILFFGMSALAYFIEVKKVFGVTFARFDPAYFGVLWDLKRDQIVHAYANINWYSLFFGASDGFRGGDFGFLAFSLSNGIVGILLFSSFVVSRINRSNALPLFLLVATSFHYPVLFFLPGQMLFGLVLARFLDAQDQVGGIQRDS